MFARLDTDGAGHVQCRMTCPICHETMRSVMLDNQEILHCANCGASFFEDNGINRISIDKARNLAKERYNLGLKPSQKPTCPRDEAALKLLSGTNSIPANVRLYLCPECLGILAPADDLELFKRAQLAKLDYCKAWNLPLGSLKGVLAIGLLVMLSGTLYYTYNAVTREATIRSEASEVIKNITTIYTGRYILISFSTRTPVRTSVVIENKTTGKTLITPVSPDLRTVHAITLDQPATGQNVAYKVRLIDRDGRTVDTKEIELK